MKRFPTWAFCAIVLGTGIFCEAAAQNDSYRLFGGAIRIDRESHWRNWLLQNDMVSSLNVPAGLASIFKIDAAGVKPVFFRRGVNLAPEALTSFYRDVIRAGGDVVYGGVGAKSNQALANQIIDDDLSTYWEPATPASYQARLRDPGDFAIDNLRSWQLDLDLGAVSFVDSITVILPSGRGEGEFLGDPVKNFALFVSMGERFPWPSGTNFKFTLLGQVSPSLGAGKIAQTGETMSGVLPYDEEGRYIKVTFYPPPLDKADFDLDGRPDMEGSFVQYVRLNVLESDLWRDIRLGIDEVGREQYEALPPEWQGALVYQRRTAGGVFVELTDEVDKTAEEKFNELPEEKRGPIVYFRKEVPRISEVQVWARGDNYTLRPEENAGGSFENGGLGTPNLATDGVYDTEWLANTWSPLYDKGLAWYDLGAVFWVDRMYLVAKLSGSGRARGAFLGHDVVVSDGTLLKPVNLEQEDDFPQLLDGLKWDNIVSEGQLDNRTPQARMMHETFPLRKVRFLQVRDIDVSGLASGRYGSQANLAELHLYGEGYPVSVWLYSPPIKLIDARGNFVRKTLPRIFWEGEAIVRGTDPITGREIEVIEPLERHPEVRVQVQTRTSDQTDTNYTYFEVVDIAGVGEKKEISSQAYDALVFKWNVWNAWEALATPHASKVDDDGDGEVDEDGIDFIDNDGDGKFDEDGKKLRASSKRPKSTPEREGELAFVGWSEWSSTYAPTDGVYEAVITSPNPRKFVQIRVNILSEDPLKTGRIRSVGIDLAPPLSLQLVGELALLTPTGMERPVQDLNVEADDYQPPKEVDPLHPQMFSYFIRAAGPDPSDSSVRLGFDEVLIVTPQASSLSGVRLGKVEVATAPDPLDTTTVLTTAIITRFTNSFERGEDGLFRDQDGNLLEIVPTGADSLYMRLPLSANAGLVDPDHGLVEVLFESQALREGVPFSSFIRDSRNPESVFQRVDTESRDATELVDSGTARPSLMATGKDLVQNLELTRVVTPNGDGVNDLLRGSFTLVKLLQERPLEVNFYDLQGRLIGRAQVPGSELTGAGNLEFAWDARDLDGELVPPGIYLCRIKIEADKSDNVLLRTVYVAY
jgi:hypothetical protein